MKRIVLTILLLNALVLQAQNSDCLSDFDYLVKKIKNDYPGYYEKVQNEKKVELIELEKRVRSKIIKSPDSCFRYLNEYSSFFKDNHLRVTYPSSKQQRERKKTTTTTYRVNVNVNYDSLRIATMQSSGLEGVWCDFNDEIAIVKKSADHYIGVANDFYGWDKHQVVWELIPDSVNSYKVIEHSNIDGVKTQNYKASLHLEGKILEIHDYSRYVRISDSKAYNFALLNSYIPVNPNGLNTYSLALSFSDSTFYLRLPNFYSSEAETLVKKHWNEIVSKPNLIIDIRNNGGGQDNYYQILLELLYTKPYASKGVEWYASEGNIKLYEDALAKGQLRNGEEGIKWVKALLREMKKNKGKFVVHPLMGSDKTIIRDTVYPYPKKVGIIINENNASSAEQFLLSALNSDKVILFGNKNTAGVLDYSNANQILFPSGNYNLICPMTRSRRLPDFPIDNIGIAPNIIIPLKETVQLYNRLDDWAYFVKSYLEYVDK